MIRLDDARAAHSQLPRPGDFGEVKDLRWLVDEVEDGNPSIVSLSCIDDDGQGDELRVIWDAEGDARLLERRPLELAGAGRRR